MKRKTAVILILCLLMALLCACGNAPQEKKEDPAPAQEVVNEETPAAEAASETEETAPEAPLSANEAYEAAMSATEEEECTDEECVVVLYDDDGDHPYNVMSPLGEVKAG